VAGRDHRGEGEEVEHPREGVGEEVRLEEEVRHLQRVQPRMLVIDSLYLLIHLTDFLHHRFDSQFQ
jgi:hypothetical protein